MLPPMTCNKIHNRLSNSTKTRTQEFPLLLLPSPTLHALSPTSSLFSPTPTTKSSKIRELVTRVQGVDVKREGGGDWSRMVIRVKEESKREDKFKAGMVLVSNYRQSLKNKVRGNISIVNRSF